MTLQNEGGSSLLGVSFPLVLLAVWLLSLADVPPAVIGFIVMVIIVVVLVVVIVKWYQYWVKKAFEEYERHEGERHDELL
jgi:tetrahydromethanopterin S-methyltransferase subunit E